MPSASWSRAPVRLPRSSTSISGKASRVDPHQGAGGAAAGLAEALGQGMPDAEQRIHIRGVEGQPDDVRQGWRRPAPAPSPDCRTTESAALRCRRRGVSRFVGVRRAPAPQENTHRDPGAATTALGEAELVLPGPRIDRLVWTASFGLPFRGCQVVARCPRAKVLAISSPSAAGLRKDSRWSSCAEKSMSPSTRRSATADRAAGSTNRAASDLEAVPPASHLRGGNLRSARQVAALDHRDPDSLPLLR